MAERLFGASIKRREDPRLITGKGLFVDDVRLPGTTHAAFVRSPHAHARVLGVEVASARAMEGVVAVYTARDLPECAKPIPPSIAAPAGFRATEQPVFADPLVRYVGEVVAAACRGARWVTPSHRISAPSTSSSCASMS